MRLMQREVCPSEGFDHDRRQVVRDDRRLLGLTESWGRPDPHPVRIPFEGLVRRFLSPLVSLPQLVCERVFLD